MRHQEQREQTHELLRSNSVDQALFASHASIAWLTGFTQPIQLGSSPFAGGPPLVWYTDGQFTLIVMDSYTSDAEQSGCNVVSYQGYSFDAPIAGAAGLIGALHDVVTKSGIHKGTLGVEANHLPLSLASVLHDELLSNAKSVAIDGWLVPLRMVKTSEELVLLRKNFSLTDVGHAAVRPAVYAGQREIDVWTTIHNAVEKAAGQRVALGNDCVVGRRQNNMGGWPLDLEIRSGDSLIVDLSTVLDGYWSDSCATYYADEPSEQQAAMHRMITQALEFAISLCKPGAVASEIDQKVRQFVSDVGYPVYPHHTVHGVGVTGHEEPRICPYNEVILAQGMVVMLEPGTYIPGNTGVRLEDAILVTSDGAEVLTTHDKSF